MKIHEGQRFSSSRTSYLTFQSSVLMLPLALCGHVCMYCHLGFCRKRNCHQKRVRILEWGGGQSVCHRRNERLGQASDVIFQQVLFPSEILSVNGDVSRWNRAAPWEPGKGVHTLPPGPTPTPSQWRRLPVRHLPSDCATSLPNFWAAYFLLAESYPWPDVGRLTPLPHSLLEPTLCEARWEWGLSGTWGQRLPAQPEGYRLPPAVFPPPPGLLGWCGSVFSVFSQMHSPPHLSSLLILVPTPSPGNASLTKASSWGCGGSGPCCEVSDPLAGLWVDFWASRNAWPGTMTFAPVCLHPWKWLSAEPQRGPTPKKGGRPRCRLCCWSVCRITATLCP